MKFALVDGKKVEATKGAKGLCQVCGSELVAKCGEVKIHHWSHKSRRHCDTWWENEGPWHRAWKDSFPLEWQEVIHQDENGERHIADVKTEAGWTLEFQHSFLNPDERRARNAFYPKLAWVIDGTRRKTDKKQFETILSESTRLPVDIPIWQLRFPDECRLFKEWRGSKGLVFFDFQEEKDDEKSKLWLLLPETSSGDLFISILSRSNFIELHYAGNFDKLFENTILPVARELDRAAQVRRKNMSYARSSRLTGFERHIANKRRRFRRL